MAAAPVDASEASTSGRSVRVRRRKRGFASSVSGDGGGGERNLKLKLSLSLSPQKPNQPPQIAVEGCCHGDLDRIYETIAELDKIPGAQGKDKRQKKIELLVICGDFQAVRNLDDLECLACPPKYRALRTFHKYYSGEARAPVLTVFVGGNHEASNHLGGLPLGGWVAPNIFYLGNAGVFRFGGLRIAGLSGIFNARHYRLGRHERPPYDADSLRSAYHVREVDCWRLGSLGVGPRRPKSGEDGDGDGNEEEGEKPSSSPPPPPPPPPPFSDRNQRVDLFVSHDWPANIALHGDAASLARTKKHLAAEVADGSLGSPPGEALLRALRPRYWFSAHLHVKFAALVRHGRKGGQGGAEEEGGEGASGEEGEETTRFLALDKCVPGRQFLQVLDVPVPAAAAAEGGEGEEGKEGGGGGEAAEGAREARLRFDPHWLAVVAKSYAASESRRRAPVELPGAARGGDFRALPEPLVRVTAEEVAAVAGRLSAALCSSDPSLPVPFNFEATAPAHGTPGAPEGRGSMPRGGTERNPQTAALLSALGLPFVEDGAGPPGASGGGEGAAFPPPPMAVRSAEEAVAAAAARVAAAGGAPRAAAAAAPASVSVPAAVDPAEIDIDGDLFEDPGTIHNMGQG